MLCLLLLAFTGCAADTESPEETGTGTVALYVPKAASFTKTLQPEASDITIAKFQVSGMYAGGEKQDLGTFEASPATLDLTAGKWVLEVVGLDSTGAALTDPASQSVDIQAGKTTSATFDLAYKSGTGTFHVTITWPAAYTKLTGLTFTITDSAGTLVKTEQIDAKSSAGQTVSFDYTLDTGTYGTRLSLTPKDGTDITDSLQMVAGKDTTGTIVVPEEYVPVADPVIEADEYGKVTITSTTEGAEIHYTTDGSEPNGTSTKYEGAFMLKESSTVKAYALKSGKFDSGVTEKQVTITKVVSGLTFNVPMNPSAYTLSVNLPEGWEKGVYTNASGTATMALVPTLANTTYEVYYDDQKITEGVNGNRIALGEGGIALEAGVHMLHVKATAGGYTFSHNTVLSILSGDTNARAKDNGASSDSFTIAWDKLVGVDGYVLNVYTNDGSTQLGDSVTVDSETTEYTFSASDTRFDSADKNAPFQVKVLPDYGGGMVEDASLVDPVRAYWFVAPDGITVNSDTNAPYYVLSWKKIDTATAYQLTENGQTSTKIDVEGLQAGQSRGTEGKAGYLALDSDGTYHYNVEGLAYTMDNLASWKRTVTLASCKDQTTTDAREASEQASRQLTNLELVNVLNTFLHTQLTAANEAFGGDWWPDHKATKYPSDFSDSSPVQIKTARGGGLYASENQDPPYMRFVSAPLAGDFKVSVYGSDGSSWVRLHTDSGASGWAGYLGTDPLQSSDAAKVTIATPYGDVTFDITQGLDFKNKQSGTYTFSDGTSIYYSDASVVAAYN